MRLVRVRNPKKGKLQYSSAAAKMLESKKYGIRRRACACACLYRKKNNTQMIYGEFRIKKLRNYYNNTVSHKICIRRSSIKIDLEL